MILGIDEAGRGPWAGPLVVGAVVLGGAEIDGLTDSKKLSKKKRESLYSEITEKALAVATGWVSAAELDDIGMSAALRLATRRAVEKITVSYSEIIIDGTVNFLADTGKGRYVKTMPKADLLIPSVSAASIMAKVERDRYMSEQDEVYPGYGFGGHAGYGVAKHRAAIEQLGVTPLHRLSFAPLQKYRTVAPERASEATEVSAGSIGEATKTIGDRAETEVANYLVRQGHEILERNWKTKVCEIDIISLHGDNVYFTEVKYRKKAEHGDGFAAITPKKLKQMTFAAELYMTKWGMKAKQPHLAAAAVTGDTFAVEDWMSLQ